MSTLFFEMFTGLPRQGPGDAASTLRALSLVPGIGRIHVCSIPAAGRGSRRACLRKTPVRIVAIDNHQPYVEELNRQAQVLGIAERLQGHVTHMHALEFPPGSFDLLWCEGSIYVVGFETALRDWYTLLAPGGHIALTEVCWRKSDPPAQCAAFWAQEYPAIRDVPARLGAIGRVRLPHDRSFPAASRSLVGRLLRPAATQHHRASRPS